MDNNINYNNSEAKDMIVCIYVCSQTRLRSILSGRFTFKFGSFNWIRFMTTSLCPFTYCTYNSEKVSRYYEKNKKREQSYVECSLYRIYPHKSDTHVQY